MKVWRRRGESEIRDAGRVKVRWIGQGEREGGWSGEGECEMPGREKVRKMKSW